MRTGKLPRHVASLVKASDKCFFSRVFTLFLPRAKSGVLSEKTCSQGREVIRLAALENPGLFSRFVERAEHMKPWHHDGSEYEKARVMVLEAARAAESEREALELAAECRAGGESRRRRI